MMETAASVPAPAQSLQRAPSRWAWAGGAVVALLVVAAVAGGLSVHHSNELKKAGAPASAPATSTFNAMTDVGSSSKNEDTSIKVTPIISPEETASIPVAATTTTTTASPPLLPSQQAAGGTFFDSTKKPTTSTQPSNIGSFLTATKTAKDSLYKNPSKESTDSSSGDGGGEDEEGGEAEVSADGQVCDVENFDQLKEAVEELGCPLINLTGDKYEIEEIIEVRRRVTIQGTPQTMPLLDGEDVARTFQVYAGAFLELRFLQIVKSEGILRDPLPWELAFGKQVLEIRGGAVFFEPGALGGNFVGVFFIDDPDPAAALQTAIRQTEEQTVIRVYGGHVFVSEGDVHFIGCMFWDLTILYPITNFIIVGGDVLNLAGVITFTGTSWYEITMFGMESGAGLFVTNLAGVTLYTFNNFLEVNFAVVENAVGQGYLTAGGVTVMTASAIDEFSALIVFDGTGEVTTLAGCQILTGVANNEIFAIGAEFGIGMEYTIGAGVVVHTGASMIEYNGIFYGSFLGELLFLGTGLLITTGSPNQEYIGIADEQGQGGVQYNGAGYLHNVGSVIIEIYSIAFIAILGEYLALDAGFMVFVGAPFIESAAIEFMRGLGSVIYVGAGALVLGAAPIIEWYTDLVSPSIDIWVMGTCEPEGGRLLGSSAGSHVADTGAIVPPSSFSSRDAKMRELTGGLPWFVKPAQGCEKLHGLYRPWKDEPDPTANSTVRGRRLNRQLVSTFRAKGGPTGHLPPQVRRHATNFHGAGRELLSESAGLNAAQAGVGLFAFDVQRIQNPKLFNQDVLQGLLPQKSIDNLATYHAKMAEINAGDPPRIREEVPMLYVNNTVDGYCGMCNVGDADGKGLESCDIQKDCASLDSAPQRLQALLGNTEAAVAGGDQSKVNYDEHHLVMATMNPTTRTSDGAEVNMAELQEAVVAAVAHLQGPGTDRETVLVNLYSGEADPHWGHLFPVQPGRSLFETPEFDHTHHFKLVAVATSANAADFLTEALNSTGVDTTHGGESPLAEAIKAAFFAARGIELGHVGLSADRQLFVPAYNSLQMLNHNRRHLGIFSTMLVDPAQPVVPLTHVAYEKPYHLYLENFPPSTAVDVDLRRVWEMEADGVALPSTASFPIKKVTTNGDGEAVLEYVFNQGSLEGQEGGYFFQATVGDGNDDGAHVQKARKIQGFSHTYFVSRAGQHKTQYGPFMHV